MPDYSPPLNDIRFVFEQIVAADELSKLSDFAHADVETMMGLLEEFGRFCAEVIAPLNREGDSVGASYDPATGAVATAPGWREAYRLYREAGWGSVPFSPDHGGGGFPWLLNIAMQEMLTSACMAFSLCPLLNQGAIDMLAHHGNEEQQEVYLRPMVASTWTGTMNLTEPQAGSDVGAVKTRAIPADDGAWRITGQKIFITYGEHDLTANIVHLVLARVPDAPAGTRGISCFIVPKVLSSGERNAVRCIGIEHKMGIHGSPTCTMEYDGATGYLIGEPNAGMRYMFTMMNNARLSVGLSGLALAERSYQAALGYARERVQGRTVLGDDTIIGHPDVRRMLLHVRSHIEAMRMLVYTNAASVDRAQHAETADDRQAAQDLVDLLTPITKAWCTDLGSALTRLGTQVFGGMGYIEETGAAQYERDIRIAAIYEGTNGIQAADLVMRKVPMQGGATVRSLLDAIAATAAASDDEFAGPLQAGLAALTDATTWLASATPADALAGSAPYLQMFGTVLGGWFMARQALAAGDDEGRRASARYFCSQVVPQAAGLLPAVIAGAGALSTTGL